MTIGSRDAASVSAETSSAVYFDLVSTTGWEQRRLRIASRIERTALELFAAHGYQEVSVEQVAAAVGLHERTVLRYFRTKEDLLLGMGRRAVSAIQAEIAQRPPEESPVEALCQSVLAADLALKDEAELRFLWAQAVATSPEAFTTMVTQQMLHISDALTARLERSYPTNMARPMAAAMAGALQGLWRQWVELGGTGQLTTFTCEGLRTLEMFTPIRAADLTGELERLRRENDELRVERDIFKRAAVAIMASEKAGTS
jgi:AcrR family transcriptional regulator